MPYKNRKNEVVHTLDDTAHKTPNDVEVEKAVLGALMIDRDAYSKIEDVVTESTFYNSYNKLIFRAIQTLVANNLPIDVLTVTNELAKLNLLEEAGGPAYVAEISSRVATSANIETHANIIAQKALARELILIGRILQDKSYDETEDKMDVKDEAEKKLYDLGLQGLSKEVIPLITSLKEALKQIQAAHSNEGGLTGVPSGYPTLDNITAGFQPSDLLILAARPGTGKTAFAINLAFNIAAQDIPVAFFSIEMTNVQLTYRIISSVCEIEGSRLLRGNLTPPEWNKIDKNVNAMDRQLFIDDTPGITIQQLRSKARFLVRQKGVKIIFVDYLQLIRTTAGRYNTRQEEVAAISSDLKALAKELNVPVFALAQMNRGVEARSGLEGKRPQLADLRESGAIEQDADVVMFLHRPEYYHIYQDDNGNDLHGVTQVIIAKHRKGALGEVNFNFDPNFMKFEDKAYANLGGRKLADIEPSDMPFPPPENRISNVRF